MAPGPHQIDHGNRLPRGRNYANGGAVRDLAIQGGQVRARVQGSRPRPYDVQVDVPPLAAAKAKALVAKLAADPGLIARLLNRQLDPAVLNEATALDIQVFPARWSDLGMRCSCPDWAVPCKHLAAVIYLLSREIDRDPHLVFKLRGVDLPHLLAAHGLQLDAEGAAGMPPPVQSALDESNGAEPAASDPAALHSLDFSTLPDLRDTLWRPLPAQPMFHPGGDFRDLAHKALRRIARAAGLQLEAALAIAVEETAPLPEGQPRIEVDGALALHIDGLVLDRVVIDSMDRLVPALQAISPDRLADLGAELAALSVLPSRALGAEGWCELTLAAVPAEYIGVPEATLQELRLMDALLLLARAHGTAPGQRRLESAHRSAGQRARAAGRRHRARIWLEAVVP